APTMIAHVAVADDTRSRQDDRIDCPARQAQDSIVRSQPGEGNMVRVSWRALLLIAISLGATAARAADGGTSGGSAVWDSVASVLKTPNVFASGYHRFNLPRRDITLHMGDVVVAPELALGAWIGFTDAAEHTMLMGDLVLTSAELAPVLSELARREIE